MSKFMLSELNAIAKEQKIPYHHGYTKCDLMVKLGIGEVLENFSPNVLWAEHNLIATDKGIKKYYNI